MNLAVDSSSGTSIFISNYPYPMLYCTVKFICSTDSSISSDIIVSTYHASNTSPYGTSNNIFVTSLPMPDIDIWNN